MKLVFGLFLVFFASTLFAQVEADTIDSHSDTSYHHSVRKAVIFSAVIPGAGQIYNHIHMPVGKKKAYWKVPLIYAGLGVTGYFLIQNQQTQLSLKTEYTNRLNGGTLNPDWQLYDDDGVLTLYNQYLDWRDLSILGFGAVYLLQIVDAGIEAHFVHFDISEDLSLSVHPQYYGSNTYGVSLSFNFR